jgi:putative ATPase
MRPKSLDDYVGQNHLMAPGAALRQSIEKNEIPSMILWGPPGVGKTSLARLIARKTKRKTIELSAINAGVKNIRAAIDSAESSQFFDQPPPILFIDEIHRFSKNQQDALLGAVESGTIVLIGATTENPSFEINNALLSRCQTYVLNPLSAEELKNLVHKALQADDTLKSMAINIEEWDALLIHSGGDARKLYNIIELAVKAAEETDAVKITNSLIESIVQQQSFAYDKKGENHYDVVSAFIKSIRGSHIDATLYWLARMINAGEKPEFICRRMIISAAEDIGLANPNALLLAQAAMQSVQSIGMPEGRIVMSEVAIYLASSPKSNSAYLAIDKALDHIRKSGPDPVPLHLRNAPTALMKELEYGTKYKYPHDHPNNFTPQPYLPEELKNIKWYQAQSNAAEKKIQQKQDERWKNS